MSLIYKCDMCGKDSAMKGVNFSDGPMIMNIDNYEQKPMRASLQLRIESEDDYQKIQNFKNFIINNFEQMENDDDDDDDDDNNNMENQYVQLTDHVIKLNNPCPLICNCCKKDLAKKILSNVEFTYPTTKCETSSVRTETSAKKLDSIIKKITNKKD